MVNYWLLVITELVTECRDSDWISLMTVAPKPSQCLKFHFINDVNMGINQTILIVLKIVNSHINVRAMCHCAFPSSVH